MTFKIAVIGCGWVSTDRHGPVYQRYAATHADVELTACCDSAAVRAEQFRVQFGFLRAYTDWQILLDAEQPSAVCLNVPETLICDLGCQIMERGYALLTEKPPGVTVAEIDRLSATARSAGVIHQVAFNRRYTPLLVELKRLLRGRTIQHIDQQFQRVGRTNYDFSATAIHAIDSVRFLADSDYEHLTYRYQEFPALSSVAPVANFLLTGTLASGATVSTSISPIAGVAVERLIVTTVDNTFFLNLNLGPDSPGRLQQFEKGNLVLDVNGAEFSASLDDGILSGFAAEDFAFFDAVRTGYQPADTFDSCRQSVEIMQCLRERKAEYSR